MKNILVTGGAGFIGSNFIRFALARDPGLQIVNLDALTYAGSLANLADISDEDRYTFIRGDICDRQLLDEILTDHRIEVIVHFAAETHVDRSLKHPEVFYKTNILGTLTLLEATREYWGEQALDGFRFHHISTDEVFGSLGVGDPPFNENSLYAPSSPYAASKAASDHLVRTYSQMYGLPVTISTSSNNYGPYQHPEKFIPLVVLNALEGRLIPVYGDGKQIRDWVYVEDNCQAIWTIINEGELGETYLIGGGNQPTNLDIVRMVCSELDVVYPDSRFIPHANLIEHISDRPGHDNRYAVNFQKLSSRLGWYPEEALEKGIKKTLSWYINNQDWVNQVTNHGEYQAWIQKHYQ